MLQIFVENVLIGQYNVM